MKKFIFLFGTIVWAALLGSCSDDIGENKVENPAQTGDEVLFGSSLSESEAETRTIYGNRTNTGIPVYWKPEGDEIMIFCPQASQPSSKMVNYLVTPSAGNNASSGAVVKVDPTEAGLQWGTEDLHKFYGFYPASNVKGASNDGVIHLSLPTLQKPAGWRLEPRGINNQRTYFALPDMDLAYMYAYNEVNKNSLNVDDPVPLKFKNLLTVIDITIPGPEPGAGTESSEMTITNINVESVNPDVILIGDFDFHLRNYDGHILGDCEPTGSMDEVRYRISIPTYVEKTEGEQVLKEGFITLKTGEYLNVKAYIIPDDGNHEHQDGASHIRPSDLKITVATLNGAPKSKTLVTASVVDHKINRVLLPYLEAGGVDYWMSNLDPNIYLSELSIPGSKFSVLTAENKAEKVYQNKTVKEQLNDGVRAFIFQTATSYSLLGGYRGLYVVCEDKDKHIKTLKEAIEEIAGFLEQCEQEGKNNEFAFVMLTYTTGDRPIGQSVEQYWIEKLRDEVNSISNEVVNRIYKDEVTASTTIDDVKGKIILKANYNSLEMISKYGSNTTPIMFTWWNGAYGPQTDGTYYQDLHGGMPMDWGKPVWFSNSPANLRWYYQEVTSVGTDQEASRADKEKFIKKLFTESVNLYKNDNSHKTWFMNDLGGYYSDNADIENRGTGIEALAIDMNQMGVEELQSRADNAGLGLIFMNFADKALESGALYKSDWLISTIIDNNFKFQLRKKTSGTTPAPSYNADYKSRCNAVGWDE